MLWLTIFINYSNLFHCLRYIDIYDFKTIFIFLSSNGTVFNIARVVISTIFGFIIFFIFLTLTSLLVKLCLNRLMKLFLFLLFFINLSFSSITLSLLFILLHLLLSLCEQSRNFCQLVLRRTFALLSNRQSLGVRIVLRLPDRLLCHIMRLVVIELDELLQCLLCCLVLSLECGF